MGIDCGDYDNDGWLDFYQTSYQRELPVLFRNLGNGLLEDVTARTGAGEGTLHNVKWGCGFVDFDNDGHRDLFVAMGHLQDMIERWDPPTTYARPGTSCCGTRATGGSSTSPTQSGDGLRPKYSSRGAAFDDLDNDGDIDAVILNSRDRPTMSAEHALRIGLAEPLAANPAPRPEDQPRRRGGPGLGPAGKLTLVDEVHAGRGYQGHFGSRLHFGLGAQDRVDQIEVHWIGGDREVFDSVGSTGRDADRGPGQPASPPVGTTGVSQE